MTPQDSFRFGFLLRCAEDGRSPQEVQALVKMAVGPVAPAVATVLNFLPGPLKGLLSGAKRVAEFPIYASAAGIGLSGLLGGGAGYGLAKLQDKDVDPDEAKQQELIATLRMQADLARRRAAQHAYQSPVPRSRSLLE